MSAVYPAPFDLVCDECGGWFDFDDVNVVDGLTGPDSWVCPICEHVNEAGV